MKKTLRIAEKWDMDVEWSEGDPEWYGMWAVQQSSHMSKPVTSSWLMFKSLDEYLGEGVISTAQELAAGIGAQSLMIREIFEPEHHLIQDLYQESIDHIDRLPQLRDTEYCEVESRAISCYDSNALVRADLIAADMGDLKASNMVPGKPQFELLDRIFKLSPTAVTIAEIGGIRLGLHRKQAEQVLGEGNCTNYRQYIEHVVGHIENTWGYRAVEVFHTGQFAKMALVPWDHALETAYTEVTNSPVGIRVL